MRDQIVVEVFNKRSQLWLEVGEEAVELVESERSCSVFVIALEELPSLELGVLVRALVSERNATCIRQRQRFPRALKRRSLRMQNFCTLETTAAAFTTRIGARRAGVVPE